MRVREGRPDRTPSEGMRRLGALRREGAYSVQPPFPREPPSADLRYGRSAEISQRRGRRTLHSDGELALTCYHIDAERRVVRTLKRRRTVYRTVPAPDFVLRKLLVLLPRDDHRPWGMHRTTARRMVKQTMIPAGIMGPIATAKGLRHGFGIRAAAIRTAAIRTAEEGMLCPTALISEQLAFLVIGSRNRKPRSHAEQRRAGAYKSYIVRF